MKMDLLKTRSRYFIAVTIFSAFLSVSALAHADDDIDDLGGPVPGHPCVARVDVEKRAPREVKVGASLTYHIRIANTGTCKLRNLRVRDFLPEKVQFRDADPTESEVIRDQPPGFDAEVLWRGIDLRRGEDIDIELVVHVLGTPNRTLENKVCVSHPLLRHRVCDTAETRVVTGET